MTQPGGGYTDGGWMYLCLLSREGGRLWQAGRHGTPPPCNVHPRPSSTLPRRPLPHTRPGGLSEIDANHGGDKFEISFLLELHPGRSSASSPFLPHEAPATFVSSSIPSPGPHTFIPSAPPPSLSSRQLALLVRTPHSFSQDRGSPTCSPKRHTDADYSIHAHVALPPLLIPRYHP